ncbi:polysaccharide biosynthesis/export family protein [Falsihalocynthiibacter sp. SS001]|uniref:polysaccharide biosynthesis/export family protein n=1 Tax=Falsihalocynthiibacter sp. SS001 TaxID=3349698 RepID=UPI0036D37687
MSRLLRVVSFVILGLTLIGCSLPRGAAISSEVVQGAGAEDAPFALHVVSRDFLPRFANWPSNHSSRSYSWISRQAGPASQVIAAGDVMNLQIWDSGDNSLISSPEQKSTPLLNLVVSPSGTIFVPYVGEVLVTGLTPDGARKELQSRIASLIPSAQVQISHTSGRRNSVDLVGGVLNAGNFPLPDRNFTILSLLAAGGGVDPDIPNPQVRLVRGNNTYGTSLTRLYENSSLDTTLRGGDKVIVDRDQRSFIALGAASNEATVYFNKDRISALDALSLMGGLLDLRADPEGVLILRNYPSSAVRTDGTGPSHDQVVFSIDLTHADGIFSAGKFEIQPGDVVLATESFVTAAGTVVGFFSALIGIAAVAN